jgi:hypothetical protein
VFIAWKACRAGLLREIGGVLLGTRKPRDFRKKAAREHAARLRIAVRSLKRRPFGPPSVAEGDLP